MTPNVPQTATSDAGRYIALLRTNRDRAAADILERQRRAVHEYAAGRGFRCVDEILIDNLSASSSAADEPLVKLADRKVTEDDFDLIVVSDWSRITRRGSITLASIVRRLRKAGVKLISASEGELDDERSWWLRGVQAYAHGLAIRSISEASKHGREVALRNGRILHSSVVPFGVDRLYVDDAGTAICIVRTENDGSQLVLDPVTSTVLRHYPRTTNVQWCGFRKHPSDRVTLVPGSPEQVNAVREIFMAKFRLGRSTSEVIRYLKDSGTVAPRGRQWTSGSVERVLSNPIYIGIGIACRQSSLPYPHFESVQSGVSAHRPPRVRRPSVEWMMLHYPKLVGVFVPDDIREMAWRWQISRLLRGVNDPSLSEPLIAELHRHRT